MWMDATSLYVSSTVNLCYMYLCLFYTFFIILGRHLRHQNNTSFSLSISVSKTYTFHPHCLLNSARSGSTHRNKGKYWDVWTTDIEVPVKHEYETICFHHTVSLWNNFLCMTHESDPTPREAHVKIPTTSLSFEAGSEVRPYCFQHKTCDLLKRGMTQCIWQV